MPTLLERAGETSRVIPLSIRIDSPFAPQSYGSRQFCNPPPRIGQLPPSWQTPCIITGLRSGLLLVLIHIDSLPVMNRDDLPEQFTQSDRTFIRWVPSWKITFRGMQST
jgi:hypothetical protein